MQTFRDSREQFDGADEFEESYNSMSKHDGNQITADSNQNQKSNQRLIVE